MKALRLALIAAGMFAVPAAFSQTLVYSNVTGPLAPGASGTFTATINNGASIFGFGFRTCVVQSQIQTLGTPVDTTGGTPNFSCGDFTAGNCPAPTTHGRTCTAAGAAAFAVPRVVTFPFTVSATPTTGSAPIQAGTSPVAAIVINGNGDETNLNVTAGSIGVTDGNLPPNVAYNPTTAAGVTFPTGAPGAATSQIAVTPSGGSGSGAPATTTVSECVLGGTTPASFSITGTPNLTFVGNTTMAQNIGLGCTRVLGTANSATLTCQERRPSTAAPVARVWDLTCPAGVNNIGPTLTYAPPPPGPVAFGNVTIPNNAVQNIVVTPSGGSGTATTTLGTCTFVGTNPAEFSLVSTAPLTFNVGATAQVNLGIRFTPALPVGAKSATITCTETVSGGATTQRSWNLTGTTVQAPPVAVFTPDRGSTIAHGTVITGQSVERTVTVQNTAAAGAANLTITGCTVTGTGFSLVGPAAFVIAPGASATITTRFAPSATGSATGQLNCTDNVGFEGGNPWNLTGTGVLPAAVPTMGGFGLWAMLGLMLGTGLVVVATRKQ